MRVINQDGTIDVPYELMSIEVRDNEIWCGYNATLEKDCIAKRFAIYSSKEKAEKAMRKLHNKYSYLWRAEHGIEYCSTSESVVFQFPQDES